MVPTISYRGIDNKTYYLLKPDGGYYNFSGTGIPSIAIIPSCVSCCWIACAIGYRNSTLMAFASTWHPAWAAIRRAIPTPTRPCSRFWPYDPILAQTKLIAEAWDAGGLYQVGSFPAYGRWAEWNGRYRDDVRRFVKGDGGMLGNIAARIQGSPDIYGERGPRASVNFLTAHDGFTLRDLVSYNHKHNEANGEDNRDGMDDNLSWNCGAEGQTDDAAVNDLRERQIKNFLCLLMVSQGVPMLLMGDEIGHSKGGNNNSYCHDSALNWFDWMPCRPKRRCFALRDT